MGSSRDGIVEEPVNREPGIEKLMQSFLTPAEVHTEASNNTKKSQPIGYERNHGAIQHLDAPSHRLTIKSDPQLSAKSLLNSLHKVYSVDNLSSKFKHRSLVAALQCAGNRRHEMGERVADVQGIDWGDGAVLNAKWEGVALRDVLLDAGLQDDLSETISSALHVHFSCPQETQEDSYYGASIPLATAMDPERECLLATHMNNEPLTPAHGFPLRVIIPGIIGARSVKWLTNITVSDRESQNFYQQKDYKILTGETAEKVQQAEEKGDKEERGRIIEGVEPMGDNPINCVVSVPSKDGESLTRDGDGRVKVRGYAIPKGKDGPVVRVEVSIDRGESWIEAKILDEGDEYNTHASNRTNSSERDKFAWVLWECLVPVDGTKDGVDIWSRATDRGGNTMDSDKPDGGWNLRGVGYNAVVGRTGIKIV